MKRIFIVIFSIVYLFVFDGLFVFAQVDDIPPSILSFDFSPKTVDVSASAASIEVIMVAEDDLSGVRDQGIITFSGPRSFGASLQRQPDGKTILQFDPKSKGAQAYKELAEEILMLS